jgi:uncharacterized protein YcbX
MIKLSEIHIYPVKSMSGISLQTGQIGSRGFEYDRRWMLINDKGDFMTQRHYPQMTFLQPTVEKSVLKIADKNTPNDSIKIPIEPYEAEKMEVPIWDDHCIALTVSREADKWLSKKLDTKCRLVFMPDTTKRQADEKYAESGDIVSFADGFPFLIIGQSSLDDLNSRLENPVPITNFRPNLVFTGAEAFAEDNWNDIKIGNLSFKVVKPCARCTITTVDQETAARSKEPLRTLAAYRRVGNDVLFGQNAICKETGEVRVGEEIEVL